MSKLTVDECKRIIMQGKKQLTAAEERITELEECLMSIEDHILGDDGYGLDYGWMLQRIHEVMR